MLCVGLQNIKWFHIIIDRKGMRLNTFINYYPDFIVLKDEELGMDSAYTLDKFVEMLKEL